LPFVYSDEVWTGIEYQVAAHLMSIGRVEEGLDIVRLVRSRHDGVRRNPFNEYECGHWYARAMSSYGMLQGLTGVRYDAVTKTLYVDSKVGDFRSFLSTATGYGTVVFENGKASLDVKLGTIPVEKIVVLNTRPQTGRAKSQAQASGATVPVDVTVTLEDVPIDGATAVFFAVSEKIMIEAVSDVNGQFQLQLEPGDYAVTFEKKIVRDGVEQNLLPRAFAHINTTPLRATVMKGKNVFAFSLAL